MARRRLPRGAAADLDAQLFLAGEIAFDTDMGVPIFGDGSKVGGWRGRGREEYHIFDVIPGRYHTAILNGSSSVDVSAWLQEALDEPGADLVFAGYLRASGLTQTQDGQTLHWPGRGFIMRNANGVILTIQGDDVECQGLRVRGESATPTYTGDNIVGTGTGLALVNCESRWAKGRALKTNGAATMILGRRGVYQTAGDTAADFDIELGQTGTSGLYAVIVGYQSTQADGGLKLVGTGSVSVGFSQFGKLEIDAGGTPTGSNAGTFTACRILGDVNVGLSNGSWTGCQFSNITMTFGAGTAGNQLIGCPTDAGFVLVNNGNGAQSLIRSVGGAGQIVHRYGSDAVHSDLGVDGSGGFFTPQSFRIGNNQAYRARNAAGTADINLVSLSTANNVAFGHGEGGTNATLQSGTGGVYLAVGGVNIMQVAANLFRPAADNVVDLGGASNRIKEIFSANATINTSDETLKTEIVPIPDAVLDAWAAVEFTQYRWIDSVEAKGDGARVHYGVIAQRLVAAFEAAGIDPWAQALICRDEWAEHEVLDRIEEVPAVLDRIEEIPAVFDDAGEVIEPARTVEHWRNMPSIEHYRTVPAGVRLGVRYEQAMVLEAALMRRTVTRLQAALTALGQ